MSISIGQKIKQLREQKAVSLEEIAKHTRIRLSTLRALEEDDYSEIASQIQARGFLKLIASYLGTDIQFLTSDSNERIEEISTFKTESEEELQKFSQEEMDSKSIGKKIEPPITEVQVTEYLFDPQDDHLPKSKQIFFEIGKILKIRRMLINLSLEEVENQIHIRKEYLLNLETGQIDNFPSPIHAKGHLQNYIKFLGLNMEELMLKYAEGLQQRHSESQSLDKKPKVATKFSSPITKAITKYLTFDLLFGTIVILGMFGFLIWGTSVLIHENREPESISELPEIAEVLITAPAISFNNETLELQQETRYIETESVQEPSPIFTPLAQTSPIQIVIIANADAWVKISRDGKPAFEGRFVPGNAYSYSANSQIEILTGNAGALQVFFNQEDLGILGLKNQVLQITFNEGGLVKPRIEPSKTPTPQPTTTSQTP